MNTPGGNVQIKNLNTKISKLYKYKVCYKKENIKTSETIIQLRNAYKKGKKNVKLMKLKQTKQINTLTNNVEKRKVIFNICNLLKKIFSNR